MSSKLIAIVAEVAKAESLVLVVQGVVHLFRGSLSLVRRVLKPSRSHKSYREGSQRKAFFAGRVDEESRTVAHVGHVDLSKFDKLWVKQTKKRKEKQPTQRNFIFEILLCDLVCQEQGHCSNTAT